MCGIPSKTSKKQKYRGQNLSGPVSRDTARLSQRYPPIARYGVFVSQDGRLGAIPSPPFSERSPLEGMPSGGAIPPPPLKRGISAIPARYPMKTRQMGGIPPSAILSRKGIARYGGYLAVGRLGQNRDNDVILSGVIRANRVIEFRTNRKFE